MRNNQCKACPWRRGVKAERDIPGGYCSTKHAELKSTIAEPGAFLPGPVRAMACHESPPGNEQHCVGWVINQLNQGDNIGLHLAVHDLKPGDVFIRQDRDAARVVSIEKNTRVLKSEKVEWYVKTATGYAPADNPKRTTSSIDETNRFLLRIEIFGRANQWHPHAGEMNLHRDHVVLAVERA